MQLAELEQAVHAGRVDDLLRKHKAKSETLRERLTRMSSEGIARAFAEGQFDSFLRGEAE